MPPSSNCGSISLKTLFNCIDNNCFKSLELLNIFSEISESNMMNNVLREIVARASVESKQQMVSIIFLLAKTIYFLFYLTLNKKI